MMKKKKSDQVPALLLLLGYNHTVGGYKPGGGHLRYLKMRRTEARTQNHQVCIALQLFSLRYSMGKSQQMFFRAFVTV
ncbi:unnamed protein product [Sphagnum balticum]